jgi:hypothetical protein
MWETSTISKCAKSPNVSVKKKGKNKDKAITATGLEGP